MAGGVGNVQYDTDPLISGTWTGVAGLTLNQVGKDFLSTGARVGLAVQNTTTGVFGHLTAVTEDGIVVDMVFAQGDTYEIYHTDTYGSIISKMWTDRRYGLKVVNSNQLINGYFPEDRDVDENGSKVFGPGEPWKTRI